MLLIMLLLLLLFLLVSLVLLLLLSLLLLLLLYLLLFGSLITSGIVRSSRSRLSKSLKKAALEKWHSKQHLTYGSYLTEEISLKIKCSLNSELVLDRVLQKLPIIFFFF